MKVYVFQAALLCQSCGEAAIKALEKTTGLPPLERREDSDVWPQGPYGQGGGEADCPQHCDHCRVFLENPLTGDGVAYTADAVRAHEQEGDGNAEVIAIWKQFYWDALAEYNESLWDETKQH